MQIKSFIQGQEVLGDPSQQQKNKDIHGHSLCLINFSHSHKRLLPIWRTPDSLELSSQASHCILTALRSLFGIPEHNS